MYVPPDALVAAKLLSKVKPLLSKSTVLLEVSTDSASLKLAYKI